MNDREQQRRIRHRLAVLRHAEAISGNVATTCRCCGISRTVFCKWRNRFDELGPEGLREPSSRPHPSPTATKGAARPNEKPSEHSNASQTASGPASTPHHRHRSSARIDVRGA